MAKWLNRLRADKSLLVNDIVQQANVYLGYFNLIFINEPLNHILIYPSSVSMIDNINK